MRNSKLAFSAAIAACATLNIGAAWAADLAARPYTKAPPMAPMVSTWTGCYVGGNVGYGWQKTSSTDVDPSNVGLYADMGSDTGSGVVGGGQVGCDYQFAGNWVIGVQGMFDGADVKGNHLVPYAYSEDYAETHSTKADWFATLTARLGLVVAPQALLYVKGGVAWVRNNFNDTDLSGAKLDPFIGTATSTRAGWTVGVGGEYKFTPNWSVFLEYNYIGLGDNTSAYSYNCGTVCGFPNPYLISDRNNLQTVLVGLNYRFGGPIVARY